MSLCNSHLIAATPLIRSHNSYSVLGKKIIPFCTNEGSGMGSSERDLRKLCVGATIVKGLPIRGSKVTESNEEICQWAKNAVK